MWLSQRKRTRVIEKFEGVCQGCGEKAVITQKKGYKLAHSVKVGADGKPIAFEVHHITPLFLGGDNNVENFLLLCRSCHRSKFHTKELSISSMGKKLGTRRKPRIWRESDI